MPDYSQLAMMSLLGIAALSVLWAFAYLILIMWEVAKEFDNEHRRRTGGKRPPGAG